MAKVNIEYDTKDKSAKCMVDGKEVPNFHSATIARSYGETEDGNPKHYLDLHQREVDKEHKTLTHHHTMASERVQASEGAEVAELADLPGHSVVTTTERVSAEQKVASDIADFLLQDIKVED